MIISDASTFEVLISSTVSDHYLYLLTLSGPLSCSCLAFHHPPPPRVVSSCPHSLDSMTQRINHSLANLLPVWPSLPVLYPPGKITVQVFAYSMPTSEQTNTAGENHTTVLMKFTCDQNLTSALNVAGQSCIPLLSHFLRWLLHLFYAFFFFFN